MEKFPEDKFSLRGLLNHLYDTEDPSQYKKYVDFSDDILESIDNNDMKTEKDNITFDRYIYDSSLSFPGSIYHLQLYNGGKDLYFKYIN